jgi:hypothetical protein
MSWLNGGAVTFASWATATSHLYDGRNARAPERHKADVRNSRRWLETSTAEMVQAQYAKKARRYFLTRFEHVTVPEKLRFFHYNGHHKLGQVPYWIRWRAGNSSEERTRLGRAEDPAYMPPPFRRALAVVDYPWQELGESRREQPRGGRGGAGRGRGKAPLVTVRWVPLEDRSSSISWLDHTGDDGEVRRRHLAAMRSITRLLIELCSKEEALSPPRDRIRYRPGKRGIEVAFKT